MEYTPMPPAELAELGEDIILLDDFDDCIVGASYTFGKGPVACYDHEKMVLKLMEGGIEDREGAEEFFDFNIGGLYAGPNSPCFLRFAQSTTHPVAAQVSQGFTDDDLDDDLDDEPLGERSCNLGDETCESCQ